MVRRVPLPERRAPNGARARACVLTAALLVTAGARAQTAETFQFPLPPQPPATQDLSVSEQQVFSQEMNDPTSLGNECQAMLQQLDAMRDEPAQWAALRRRYWAQCQSGFDGAPRYVPHLLP